MSNVVERIAAKFGGLAKMARALGHRYPTTVQGWKDRDTIPARQQPLVLEAGRGLPDPVTPADFFDIPHNPTPTGSAAQAADAA